MSRCRRPPPGPRMHRRSQAELGSNPDAAAAIDGQREQTRRKGGQGGGEGGYRGAWRDPELERTGKDLEITRFDFASWPQLAIRPSHDPCPDLTSLLPLRIDLLSS